VVTVGGKETTVRPAARLRILIETMLDRGDPNYVFEAAVTIEKTGAAWRVTGS